MERYFNIFLKSVITATGITFIAGICFISKTLISNNYTLDAIEKRVQNIERIVIIKNDYK